MRKALKTKVERVARRDGAERLRQEADRVIKRNTRKLVGMLEEKALKGNMEGFKVLLSLAEKKAPPAEKPKGPILTLGQRMAMEPKLPKHTPIPGWGDEGEED